MKTSVACFCTCAILHLALASCTVGPNYRRPAQGMPTTFKSATTQEAEPHHLAADWWKLFADSALDKLEEEAIAANPDLKAAMARVWQARAAARITASQFFPLITLDPSATRTMTSANRPSPGPTPAVSTTANDIRVPFDLSYEVDVWGRIRRSYEASVAQARASEADFQVVLQTLEADVAQDYFNIRALDSQQQILAESVELYRRQLGLTQKKLAAQIVGKIDIYQAQTQLNSAIAQEVEVRRQRLDLEHAVAILLGRTPGASVVATQPLTEVPPAIPAGLPAELLRHRPDVAEAEQNLIAANAQVGAAIAQFYPKFHLIGTAGFESAEFSSALDWQSRMWSAGPSVSVPIFEGGQLKATLEQSKGRYAELAETYRSHVLAALRDVEDALTDLHLRADEAFAEDEAVQAAREYLRLSQVQYDVGLISYLVVIDAQRTLLTNELTAVQIASQRMTSAVLLIKALGGGWDAISPPPPPEAGAGRSP